MTLITRHLVRVLKTAPSVQALDATTFGIQELLRHYSPGGATGQQTAGLGGSVGGGDSGKAGRSREATPAGHNELFAQLPEEVRAIVRPYLDSKYSVRSNKRAAAVVFGSQPGMSFRRWLAMWLQQLIDSYASGGWVGGRSRSADACGWSGRGFLAATSGQALRMCVQGGRALWRGCTAPGHAGTPFGAASCGCAACAGLSGPPVPLCYCPPCTGERLWLFQAVFPVLRFDIPTALFIMPYLVENVVFHGSDKVCTTRCC